MSSRDPTKQLLMVHGAHWRAVQAAGEMLEEVTASAATLPQHAKGRQTSLCSHFLTSQNDLA